MKKVFCLFFVFSFLNIFSQATEKKEKEVCPIEFGTSFTISSEANDEWKFNCACTIKEFHMTVYSSWGTEVLKADSLPPSKSLKWDLKKLAAGSYMYVLSCVVENDGVSLSKTRSGTITFLADADKKGNREE